MTGLHIAEGLDLPLEAITETFVILAKRGSGKTYTANVMAEEMIGAGHPAVIIDPVGVWWGLRSSADGKSDGLPVAIFGGDHADVPLDENAGAVVADAIVTERFPAIIDLSLLSKSAARRFMTAFIERLYHRNRDPLHIFIDEADAFAPQRAAADGARLLGAMEDLVRRGRARGLGCTLITQRPAVLHKDVLSQAEVLICLRMTGVRDVAAIDEWIKLHDVDDQAATLKGSLPSLPRGTAWVWSPGWLELLQRVEIRKRTTFDSSATPAIGEQRIVPKQMADIDLAALGEKIAATAEQVKANDPKALKARIAQLEREVANRPADIERVEVPVLTPGDQGALVGIDSGLTGILSKLTEMSNYFAEITTRLAPLMPPQEGKQGSVQSRDSAPAAVRPDAVRGPRTSGSSTTREKDPSAARETRPAAADGPRLRAGAIRILETIARQHPMRLTKSQLGTLAQFKTTGGTFRTYWGELNRLGFIDDDGHTFTLTPAGFDYVGIEPGNPMTVEEIVDSYRQVLRAGERNMLDLVVANPAGIDRADLATALDMTETGGTFRTYLGRLRTNGLVDVDGQLVTPSSILNPEGTRA